MARPWLIGSNRMTRPTKNMHETVAETGILGCRLCTYKNVLFYAKICAICELLKCNSHTLSFGLKTVPLNHSCEDVFVCGFLIFWATVCKTVRRMLLDRCLSCPVCLSRLSVTLVYCGQTVGQIKMKLGTEVGHGPGHIVLDENPAPLPQRGQSPQFLAHICCGQNGCRDQDAT